MPEAMHGAMLTGCSEQSTQRTQQTQRNVRIQDLGENPSVSYPPNFENGGIKRRRFDDVTRDRFVVLEAEGRSAGEIAALMGVSPRTITRWRRKLDKSHGAPNVPASPEDRARALQLLADGCSIRETARTVGVSNTTVARWFPDAPRWTRHESGVFAAMHRREASRVV